MTTDPLARLQRRYERERRARLAAEAIAEAGLRDLTDLNASLDAKVRDRTKALEQATQRAEAANAAKDLFLAHASHELRTPINGLAGMLELLADVVTENPAADWLQAARTSSDRLGRLVERLLWFVELSSGDVAGKSAAEQVEQVVDRAATRWRLRCAGVGQLLSVEVSTPGGALVSVGPDIDRVLDELLENAVQHADSGSVRVIAEPAGPQRIRLAVQDSGPGMQVGLGEVLDPGATPQTRGDHGAGIGLGVVRQWAVAHGAAFGVDQRDGGSVVWVELASPQP